MPMCWCSMCVNALPCAIIYCWLAPVRWTEESPAAKLHSGPLLPPGEARHGLQHTSILSFIKNFCTFTCIDFYHLIHLPWPVPRCSTAPLHSSPTPVCVTASLVYVMPFRTSRGAAVTLFSIKGWSRTNVNTLSGSFREDSTPSAFKALFKHCKMRREINTAECRAVWP